VFHHAQRVAAHPKVDRRGRHSTVDSQMPAHHRVPEWSPQRLIDWAAQSGPATAQLIDAILATRRHPEQGYRSCLGILRLGERFGSTRLNAACQRALAIKALSYRSVESILTHGLDAQPVTPTEPTTRLPHANLRGADYFH
jgi:transposase